MLLCQLVVAQSHSYIFIVPCLDEATSSENPIAYNWEVATRDTRVS